MTCPTPRVARVLVPLVSAALLGLSACQDAPLLPARTPATRSITVGAVPSTPLTVLTRHATPTTPELLGIDQAVITDFFRNGQVRSLLGGATPAVAYVRSDFPDTNVPLPPRRASATRGGSAGRRTDVRGPGAARWDPYRTGIPSAGARLPAAVGRGRHAHRLDQRLPLPAADDQRLRGIPQYRLSGDQVGIRLEGGTVRHRGILNPAAWRHRADVCSRSAAPGRGSQRLGRLCSRLNRADRSRF